MTKFRKELVAVLSALCLIATMLLFASCTKNDSEVTLTFMNGSDVYATITAEAGESITAPTDPVQDGYTFSGWYLTADGTGSAQTVTTAPDEDTTYYAGWTQNASGGNETFSVSYTVELYLQNLTLDGYELSDDTVSGTGTAGESLTVAAPSVTGFVYSENDGEVATLTLSGTASDNVFRFYYDRETYILNYSSNAPSGTTVSGSTTYNTALYGVEITVAESGYSISGYRFFGWATAASGAVVYQAGDTIYLTGNTTIYAVWGKGYTDRFGGDDIIYYAASSGDTVYLEREGLEEKTGVYDAETGLFTFTLDNGDTVTGSLNPDSTFTYYGAAAEGTYYYYDTNSGSYYTSATLTLDGYYEAVYTVDGTTYTGSYIYDEDAGYYLFESTSGYFYFYLGTYSGISVFAVVGEEAGTYYQFTLYTSTGYGYLSYVLLYLTGTGYAYLYEYSSTYGYYTLTGLGYYAIDSSGECYLMLYDYYYYYYGYSVTYLEGYCTLLSLSSGYLCFVMKDEAAEGTFTSSDGSALVLDGYGYSSTSATYTVNGTSYSGTYYVEGDYPSGNVVVEMTDTSGNTYTFVITGSTFTRVSSGYSEFVEMTDDNGTLEFGSTYLIFDGDGYVYVYTFTYDENYTVTSYSLVAVGTYTYSSSTDLYTVSWSAGETFYTVECGMYTYGGYSVYIVYSSSYCTEYTSETLGVLTLHSYGVGTYVSSSTVMNGTWSVLYDTDAFGDTIIVFTYDTYYYFVLNDDGTFVTASGLYGTAAYYDETGSTGEDTLAFRANSSEAIYTQGDTEIAGTYAANGSVYTFTSSDGATTFNFIVLYSSSAMYFSVYHETYSGTFTSSSDGTITLDGYIYSATWNYGGVTYSGIYYVSGTVLGFYESSEGQYYYFDVDWTAKTFTARDAFAYYYFYNTQYGEAYGSTAFVFDGAGSFAYYYYSSSGWVEYLTGTYTIMDADAILVAIVYSGYTDILWLTQDESGYNVFYIYDGLEGTYTSDQWTVVTFDGFGNAVYIDEYGVKNAAVYTIDSDTSVTLEYNDGSESFVLTLDVENYTFAVDDSIVSELTAYAAWYSSDSSGYVYTTSYGIVLTTHYDSGDDMYWYTATGSIISGTSDSGYYGWSFTDAPVTYEGYSSSYGYVFSLTTASSSYYYVIEFFISYSSSVGAYICYYYSSDYTTSSYIASYSTTDGSFVLTVYYSSTYGSTYVYNALYNGRAVSMVGSYECSDGYLYLFYDAGYTRLFAYVMTSSGTLTAVNFASVTTSDGSYLFYVIYDDNGNVTEIVAFGAEDEDGNYSALTFTYTAGSNGTFTVTDSDGNVYAVTFSVDSSGNLTVSVTVTASSDSGAVQV